jgi:aspartate racemase
MKPRKIIGILGGLGPYAHLDLERKLLRAARELAGAARDQDFPEWIVSSVPQTPDRTAAIRGAGPSPLPALVRSLRRLEAHTTAAGETVPGADFVIIPCNTAHHYLADLRRVTELPLVDMIGEVAAELGRGLAKGSRIGLLATTGTLEGGLYHRALAERGLEGRSLLEAPRGEELQRRLVMEAIYGPLEDGRHAGGGLKSGGATEEARARLLRAAETLVAELGCRALVAGCTEVPLALPDAEVAGVPLVDPVAVLARVAVARAYGLPG